MGARGPVPKRTDQRRRRNAPATPVTSAPSGPPSAAAKAGARGRSSTSPSADDPATWAPSPAKAGWHPTAKQLWTALGQSGQARYYQPSDWAVAFLLCESITADLRPQTVITPDGHPIRVTRPPSASSIAAWLKGLGSLMATEGDRRRLAMELAAPPAEGADEEEGAHVVWLADAAARVTGTG
jgi:hypothetical protein